MRLCALRRLLILLPLLSLAAGCASTPAPPYHPDVSLTNLHLDSPTLFETPAVFTVRIDNDAPTPLTLVGASYRISLNGHRIGKGLSNHAQTIAALSSATDEVTFHLGNLAMAQQIKDIVESEQVSYQLTCTLYVQDGNRSRSVEVVREGVVALSQFTPTAGAAHAPSSAPATPPPAW